MQRAAANQENPRKRDQWPVVIPLTFAILASLLIRLFDMDRKISELNYDATRNFWPCERADPWLSFYRYGTYPPVILGIAGGLVWLLAGRLWSNGADFNNPKRQQVGQDSSIGTELRRSRFGLLSSSRNASITGLSPDAAESRIKTIRQHGLFLLLMLLIGPGLVVNTGLKELCGRPRPLQCQEFGGELAFRHVGEIAAHRFPNSSFPSGHAAVAFFIMAPAFLISANRPKARRAWIAAGIFYGLAMGFTRVLQGGHFVSDVLWAGIIVYLVGVGLARLLLPHEADGEAVSVQDSISIAPTS